MAYYLTFALSACGAAATAKLAAPTAPLTNEFGWPNDHADHRRLLQTLGVVYSNDSTNYIKGCFIVTMKEDEISEGRRLKKESKDTKTDMLAGKLRSQCGTTEKRVSISRKFTKATHGLALCASPACVQEILSDSDVKEVEQDEWVQSTAAQINPEWGLDRIDQETGGSNLDARYEAGDLNGEGVDVYVLDTGINTQHSEYADRVLGGVDFIGDGNGYEDCNGHGSHVAGIAVGTTYGVAKKANLFGIRVLSCNGYGSASGVIAGLDWVVSNDASTEHSSVVAMSLTGGTSNALISAVESATQAGLTVVVAAGNSNSDACNYSPANAPSAITVGASTQSDARATYSNYGTCVDVFAPGSTITSAWIRKEGSNPNRVLSGTSVACPHVAGAAALELQLMEREGVADKSAAAVAGRLETKASVGQLSEVWYGSPNLLLRTSMANFFPTPAPEPTDSPTPALPTPAPSSPPTIFGSPTQAPTHAPTTKTNAPTPAVTDVSASVDQGTIDGTDEDANQIEATPAPTPAPAPGWTVTSGGEHCKRSLTLDGFCMQDLSGNYESNSECEFTYTGSATLSREEWQLESHGSCAYDYLEVGGVKYCGDSAHGKAFPTSMNVNGVTTFKFKSDHSENYSGFKICDTSGWKVNSRAAGASVSNAATDICQVTISASGLCVYDDTGITPVDYATDIDCDFDFIGNGVLHNTEFSLEPHATCDWDYLEVNGKKYCGTNLPSTVAVVGSTPFKFHSDYSVSDRGFQICYKPDWFDVSGHSTGTSSFQAFVSSAPTFVVDGAAVTNDDPHPNAVGKSATGEREKMVSWMWSDPEVAAFEATETTVEIVEKTTATPTPTPTNKPVSKPNNKPTDVHAPGPKRFSPDGSYITPNNKEGAKVASEMVQEKGEACGTFCKTGAGAAGLVVLAIGAVALVVRSKSQGSSGKDSRPVVKVQRAEPQPVTTMDLEGALATRI